jgi:hypothetical protein
MTMMAPIWLLPLAGCIALAAAETAEPAPDAAAIMTKVAANTAASVDARRQYVYHQKIRASMIRMNGQPVRRETREYSVVPQKETTDKMLTAFSGEYLRGKRMTAYSMPGVKDKGDENDRRNLQSLTDELVNAGNARDGIPHDLFPLNADDLKYYKFTLKGDAAIAGRKAFDILFEPADSEGVCVRVGSTLHIDINSGSDPAREDGGVCRQWKGEAWIDAEDYQPVRIVTKMAKGVPWGVRFFMGINIKQFGFSIDYTRVAPGVWFPKTYGTEFAIEVLWGYKRSVTLSMENGDFRRTDARSTIRFEP